MLHILFTKDVSRATLKVVEHVVGPGGHPVNYKRKSALLAAGALLASGIMLRLVRLLRQR
jgi:hypothetical protein